MERTQWNGFKAGNWQNEIDVRNFIQTNYTPYEGDESFLAAATPRTEKLMKKLNHLFDLEQQFGGVLDIDAELSVYISGLGQVRFEFSGAGKIKEISQAMAEYIL